MVSIKHMKNIFSFRNQLLLLACEPILLSRLTFQHEQDIFRQVHLMNRPSPGSGSGAVGTAALHGLRHSELMPREATEKSLLKKVGSCTGRFKS